MSDSTVRRPLDRAAREVAKRALRGVVRRWAPRRQDLPPSDWGLARDADGALALDGVVLDELIGRFGSPLYVVDARRLARNAARFRAGAPDVFYSYKTNPVPGVLRALHAAGIGAEVASEYELWLALTLGVDPARIVYNGPAKSTASSVLALERGVGLLNVNSRGEIAPLAAAARRLGKRPLVGVRVAGPSTISGQFGERIETGAAFAAFAEARSHPELRVGALHAHANGEIASAARLDRFLDEVLAFSDELHERLGLDVEVLDLGGNLACPTVSKIPAATRRLAVTFGCEPSPRDPATVLSVESYVERVSGRVAEHFAAAGRPAPRVFLEPGRALTSDAQMLLCRVASVRDEDEWGLTWAVLDAGLNVAEPTQSEFHQLFALRPRPDATERLYRLTGPTCTLADQLYPAWRLPEVAPGDGLAIMDAGAYFVPFSTCFSYPRPGIVLLDGGRVEELRSAETFEDLVSRDARSFAGSYDLSTHR